MSSPLYDRIGHVYSRTRRTDERIARIIWRGLGDARTVINVGAGAGSYEPPDCRVVAVEPSWRMIHQRSGAVPVVCGIAEALPFPIGAFDAALAILTLHHWTDWRRGLTEMRRVARRQVVVTIDPAKLDAFWLTAAYFQEIGELDQRRCPRSPTSLTRSVLATSSRYRFRTTAAMDFSLPTGDGPRPISIPPSARASRR